jgi:D-methionine transport system ATP-binding protein
VISISNVSKTYGHGTQVVKALQDVSLQVEAGEIFGVLGQSGAGKSTLIRCVNLLERPDSGSVRVNGQDMTALSGPKLRQARQQIGMIFQHFNLLSSRTVAENVALPLEVTKFNRAARQARVAELLELVGLSGKANAYPAQLSGGQKQRVGIARALAAEPEVLLCDEATSALDPQTTRSILDLLKELNRRLGLTILLITHEMGVVRQICDRVAILEAGKIVEQGTVAELAVRPNSRLGQEFFPRKVDFTTEPGAVLATITFSGAAADQPVLTTLARNYELDVNILSGTLETVGGQRIGQLQIELRGKRIPEALGSLQQQGLAVEVQS